MKTFIVEWKGPWMGPKETARNSIEANSKTEAMENIIDLHPTSKITFISVEEN